MPCVNMLHWGRALHTYLPLYPSINIHNVLYITDDRLYTRLISFLFLRRKNVCEQAVLTSICQTMLRPRLWIQCWANTVKYYVCWPFISLAIFYCSFLWMYSNILPMWKIQVRLVDCVLGRARKTSCISECVWFHPII